MFFAMPVLIATPCLAVPVRVAPLKGMTVAGSDTAANGKEMVATKTCTTVKGSSSKTVTKTPAKAPSKAPSKVSSKPPSKAPSKASLKPPSKAPSKALSSAKPPSKHPSSAPARSTTFKKSTTITATKSTAAVVSKTVVSVSTKVSSTPPSATLSASASDKTTASLKAARVKAITAPFPNLPGMKYIYPKHNTCIHVILRCKVWESCDKDFTCKTFLVPTILSINELLEQLIGREGEVCNGWVLTEVMEKGDGGFEKGTSVEFGGDKAGGTLRAVGWSEKNGGERPPVWVVLHQG
ncbi:hypothetical protein E4T43_03492 [Aureobasidium subglaciale]|nr:hypothetical protein E4T43_03492 [Aureobasidium subglaciale]